MPWRNYWAGQRKGRSRGRDILKGLGMGLWRGGWVGSSYKVVWPVRAFIYHKGYEREEEKCLTVFPFGYDP